MLFLGHIGISVEGVHLANRIFGYKTDLRKVAIAAVLADWVDKPLAMLFHEELGNHTRLFGHSILFSLAAFAAYWLLTKRALREAFTLWCVLAGHLVLDLMWRKNLEFLFWPVLGLPPALERTITQSWARSIVHPYNVAGELTGVGILLYLQYRRGRTKLTSSDGSGRS